MAEAPLSGPAAGVRQQLAGRGLQPGTSGVGGGKPSWASERPPRWRGLWAPEGAMTTRAVAPGALVYLPTLNRSAARASRSAPIRSSIHSRLTSFT